MAFSLNALMFLSIGTFAYWTKTFSILYVFGDLPIVLLGVSELDISSHILLPSGRVPILFERALLINYGSVYQYTHHKIHNYCDF